MASRFLEKLVSPVIAGLVLSAVGLVSLPTGHRRQPRRYQTGPFLRNCRRSNGQRCCLNWATLHRKWRSCTDPKTHSTQLLIRSPKSHHVRKHWHSANETHTIITGTAAFARDGKKAEFGPGGFNYIPARRVHEAWVAAGAVIFITLDGPWDQNWVEGSPTAADVTP
jgi:mannose-6-phosphate isomerase-like protein (cupin superfamily)